MSSSWPSDIKKWMKLNANPRMMIKLMKVSKYFHRSEFPFTVLKRFSTFGTEWDCITLDNEENTVIFEDLPEKLWISETLDLSYTNNLVSLLLSKTVVCDVKNLRIRNQILTFDEFKFLTEGNNVKEIVIEFCEIKYSENGEKVEFENILQCLPNVENFSIYSDALTEAPSIISLEKACTIVPQKLKYLRLSNLKSGFNEKIFFEFVKRNPNIEYKFSFERSYADYHCKYIQKNVMEINQAWMNINSTIDFYVQTVTTKVGRKRRAQLSPRNCRPRKLHVVIRQNDAAEGDAIKKQPSKTISPITNENAPEFFHLEFKQVLLP